MVKSQASRPSDPSSNPAQPLFPCGRVMRARARAVLALAARAVRHVCSSYGQSQCERAFRETPQCEHADNTSAFNAHTRKRS